jgi:hypothetical protein
MNFKHLSLTAAFIVAVSGSNVAVVAKEAQPIKIENVASFKGVDKAVIGQFTVVFLTKKVDYDGGGFLSMSSKGKAIGHLVGLENADFQSVTDSVYDDFTKQMATRGIAIVDGAGLAANKYYAKVKQEAQANKVDIVQKKEDHADGLAFWPTQLGRNLNVILPLRLMDMNMSNTYTAEYDYARNSKVPVLNVIYYVDFAKPAKSSGGGLLQDINVSAGLAISQFGSQAHLMDTNGKVAKILLQTPIEEGGDFADIKETTSSVTKVAQVASVLGAGLFGGRSGGASARFEYQITDKSAYQEKTMSAANKASDLFLRMMEANR